MISLSNRIDNYSRRFRSLVLITVITVYLLVLAGGIVRGTGSGMGCPDWPKCFGQWVPPTEVSQLPSNYQEIYGSRLKGEVEFNAVKTWIEYVNRLLGAFSGFLVLATFVASLRYLRTNQFIFWGSLSALLLIGANGWLGSRVVATELSQYVITLHLLLAILLVFSLLFVLIKSGNSSRDFTLQRKSIKTLDWLLVVTMSLSLSQVVLGAQVRDALNEVVQRIGYDQRDNWIGNLDWRFYVHRSFSLIVLGFNIWFIYQLHKTVSGSTIRHLASALVGLIVVEIATGAIMAYFAVPAVAQPVHLFLAIVMVGLQFVIWLLLHPSLNSSKQALDTARLQKI